MYEANQRQGTFGSKSRAMVAGSTKKMYRQKGTGNARAGSRRSGIRRGGGHIFAKRPRDFGYRLPRKALQLATRMAVASKIRDEQITVIDDFKLSAPKTRDMAAIIKAVKCHEASTLLVATAQHDVNVYKSARNIEGVAVSPVAELNAWTVLRPRHLLFTKAALEWIKERAGKGGERSVKPKSRQGKTCHQKDQIGRARLSHEQLKQPRPMPPVSRHAPHALLAPHQIIVRPLVTEKGMHRSTRYNAYAFEVNKLATKQDIRKAVEELFNVKVLRVHVQNRKGKPRRSRIPRRRARKPGKKRS